MYAHSRIPLGFLGPFAIRCLERTRKSRFRHNRFLCESTVHHAGTRVHLPTFKHTESLGRLLGASVIPGSVVLLHGELGAGKTCFARGFIRAAMRDLSVEVTSPTFLLANEYPVMSDSGTEEFKIFHMDLWRLKDSSSRRIVDFEDVFANHVAIVEWPDRLGEMIPEERLDVFLEYVDLPVTEHNPWGFADHDSAAGTSSDGRKVTLVPRNEFWEGRVQAIAQDLRCMVQADCHEG